MKYTTIELNDKEFESIKYITNSNNNKEIGMLSKDLIVDYNRFIDQNTRKLIVKNKIDYVIFIRKFA